MQKSDSKTFGTVTDAGTYEVHGWYGSAWRLLARGSREVCLEFLDKYRKSNPAKDATDFSMRPVN